MGSLQLDTEKKATTQTAANKRKPSSGDRNGRSAADRPNRNNASGGSSKEQGNMPAKITGK